MAAAYSMDLRERVIEDADAGLSAKDWRRGITSVGRGSMPSSSGAVRPARSRRANRRGSDDESWQALVDVRPPRQVKS